MKENNKNRESLNIKVGVILSLLSFVVSMVVNVIFIRYLNNPNIAGQSQYGLYTFSTSMTSLLLALSFGMNSSYIRFATIAKKEEGKDGLKRINGAFALLFIIAAILAVIIGTLIIVAFYKGLIGTNYDDSKRAIIISCLIFSVINVAVSLISNIFTLYTNFNMKFIWARVLTISISIMTPLITSIIIYFNHNIVTYVCVELGVNFIALLINMFFCIKALKYKVKISFKRSDFHILKNIVIFSFFIFLVTAVTELTSSTPKILLGLFPNASGDSEITVAYYQLSATFIGAIAVAASAVSSTYVPLVNRYVAYGSNEDVNRLFLKSTKIMIIAYALVMGGFIACGKQFVILWQGSHYKNTDLIYYIACLLSIISFVPSTFGISSEVQRAKNKHHFRSFALLIGFTANLVVSLVFLLLLPNFVDKNDSNYFVYQVIGCAVGFGVGNLVNAIIMSLYNHRVIRLNMIGYYKIILVNLLYVLGPVLIIHALFTYLPIKIGLIMELVIRGTLFVLLFVVLLLVFERKFLISLFRKEDTEIRTSNSIVAENQTLNGLKKIFVLRDFDLVLDSFSQREKDTSLFENSTMRRLRSYNKKFHSKFILIISNRVDIKRIPKRVFLDLRENSNWLSVAFGGGKHSPYTFIDAPFITKDLSTFISVFSKHKVKIENFVFPETILNDTQISYFANYFGFSIKGIATFDGEGLNPFEVNVKKNLLSVSCLNLLEHDSALSYFYCRDADKIESKLTDGCSDISDLLKQCFSKKNFEYFYDKKVAVINTYSGLSTGNLAKSIIKASNEAGIVTKFFYGRVRDDNDLSSYYFGTNKFINLINNIYVKLSGNIGGAHYFETKSLIKKLREFGPDIIHLHNIGGNCLNYRLLFNYLKDKRVVVTMHDCFWLTGRCHHFTYGQITCEKWQNGCGKCEHLNFYMQSYFFDKSKKLFALKRSFIQSCKHLRLVCLSEWQKKYFDISGISKDKIRLIHNGIECNTKQNLDAYGIPRKLIFVSSFLTKDKGIDEINLLASTLSKSQYKIEVIGKLPRKEKLNPNIVYSDVLSHTQTIERIATSDLFVYPTHADTLPTVLIESIMVGTPVIAYDVGGCPEIISGCGISVPYGDFESLLSTIKGFNFDSFNRRKICDIANERFNKQKMTDNYLALYKEVLDDE